MNGIHDMGGMHGFGRVTVEANEPVFHAGWEKRVLGIVYQLVGFGWANLDAFRHAIERIEPVEYLTTGYYGRWLASAERLAVEGGLLAEGHVAARAAGRHVAAPNTVPAPLAAPGLGFERDVDRAPRFRAGDAVRTRVTSPSGHTRLPRYVAGRRGVVHLVRAAYVYPDSNAHGRGECPQHLYNVRFTAAELWGAGAEPGATLHLDCFEPYLEPA